MKKSYQFTLILKNIDENTPHLEDSLYKVGCDDALINFRYGAVFLDFDRIGSTLEEAVLSAITDVESSSIQAVVANVGPEDLVTESEIAKRMKMNRQAISLWIKGARRKSKPFPKPIMRLSDRSPFWKWHEIVEWLYENKILVDREEVVNAYFLKNVNAALDERNPAKRKIRRHLLRKIENNIPRKVRDPRKN